MQLSSAKKTLWSLTCQASPLVILGLIDFRAVADLSIAERTGSRASADVRGGAWMKHAQVVASAAATLTLAMIELQDRVLQATVMPMAAMEV